jgi:hypothetical protein
VPLHTYGLCPYQLVQCFGLPSQYYRKSDCTISLHGLYEG